VMDPDRAAAWAIVACWVALILLLVTGVIE
jgi:hypothetical protein